jgi:DNA-binding transcriptional LysR family regulator
MLRGLRDGELDLALLVQVSAKVMNGLVFEELRRYAVCVAVPLAHPLARARKVGVKKLVDERLIAFTLADYPEHHMWLADLFAPFKHLPQIAEEHDSATSLIAAVEAGRGVALVQEAFKCFAGQRVKLRALEPAPPPLVVGIACRREMKSSAAENFIAAARSATTP